MLFFKEWLVCLFVKKIREPCQVLKVQVKSLVLFAAVSDQLQHLFVPQFPHHKNGNNIHSQLLFLGPMPLARVMVGNSSISEDFLAL